MGKFFEKLKAGLEDAIAYKKGKLRLRSESIEVPEPAAEYTAKEIKKIRQSNKHVLGPKKMNDVTKISIFEGKQIRRVFIENQWWFSVIDIIGFLTDSKKPRDYWHKMKIREKNSSEIELPTNCRQLKLISPDGKKRETDCANTEGIFRIIQSISGSKIYIFRCQDNKICPI